MSNTRRRTVPRRTKSPKSLGSKKSGKKVDSTELLEDTKSSIKKLKQAYMDFLEDDSRVQTDSLQSYDFDQENIVLQVFLFKEDYESGIGDSLSKENKVPKNVRYFSIAKVLGGSEDALEEYPAGSHVFLNDTDVSTITNPGYSLWLKNSMKESNAHKVGSEPPETMSRIASMQQSNMFIIDKIKLFSTEEDYLTFCLHKNSVKGAIKNPEKLFSDNGFS